MAKNNGDTISLWGMTSQEIADLISSGTITQKDAEKFVSERAIHKLRKKLAA